MSIRVTDLFPKSFIHLRNFIHRGKRVAVTTKDKASAVWVHAPCKHSPSANTLHLCKCGDITNTLVGISGETVPEGGNLHIY